MRETETTENGNLNKTTKIMAVIMVIMFVGKALGLLRNMQIADMFGTESIEAGAYTAMSAIPRNFLDAAFASAISASFIPIFNKYLKLSKETAFRLADTFITLILIASFALTLIGVLFAPQIINVLYGFDSETHILAVPLLRITLFTVVLSGAAFSFVGVLQSLGGFYAPAAMSIMSNGMIIGYNFFLIERFGLTGLAIVFVIGWGAQVLVQIVPLIRRGYVYRPSLNFSDGGLREIGALALPVMVSTWVVPVNIQVNQRVAETFDNGAAVVDHAYNLYAVISGLFVLAIANVIFPKLSREADDSVAFADTLRETILGMLFLLIPIMFGLFLLSEPLVSLMLERGEFDGLSTIRTSSALKFYALGIPGFGLFTILSRGFYAAKNGKIPLLTALAAIAINLVLSIIFANYMGVGGVALASAASVNFTGLVMLLAMTRRLNGLITVKAIVNVAKIFISGVLMAFVVYFVRGFVAERSVFLILLVSTGAGVSVYFITSIVLGLPQVKIIKALRRK